MNGFVEFWLLYAWMPSSWPSAWLVPGLPSFYFYLLICWFVDNLLQFYFKCPCFWYFGIISSWVPVLYVHLFRVSCCWVWSFHMCTFLCICWFLRYCVPNGLIWFRMKVWWSWPKRLFGATACLDARARSCGCARSIIVLLLDGTPSLSLSTRCDRLCH